MKRVWNVPKGEGMRGSIEGSVCGRTANSVGVD